MKRVGILTSGGDCQGLNPAIRGVAKGLYEEFGKNVEIYGIKDGYKGLIFGEYKLMEPSDFSGILTEGGTILGTSRQPFKTIRVIDENSVDKVAAMKSHYKKMKLDCFEPFGAFYVFPCIKEFGMTSEEFATRMLQEEKVVVVPGTAFGDCGEGFLRISYAYSLDSLKEALDRMEAFLAKLRK